MPPDERFFMGLFLPMMIGLGVLLVVGVVVANVVFARRRYRALPPPFVPPIPGASQFGTAHTVSKTTTTTSADGSVTITVIEETTGGTPGSVNGVVDPELFTNLGTNGDLEREILTEVRDAFRRMGVKPDDPTVRP